MDQIAIVAGGCFWCTEAVFRQISGVSAAQSGYIGGGTPNPTYRDVCSGRTGHAEAVKITFDPAIVSLAEIYDIFMATHDPTQLNRQGHDVGTQYRSAIFPQDEDQRAQALAAIARANRALAGKVVTRIEGLEDGEPSTWYPAEADHQRYWEGEGQRNPYCLAVIPPKLAKLRQNFADRISPG